MYFFPRVTILLLLFGFGQARIPSKGARVLEDEQVTQYEEERNRLLQGGGCEPLYPPPTNIVFNITKDFFIHKVNVTRTLASVVSREHSGKPIDDLIEEQRQIYELFDGFSDINDQALVAKTKDTQTCFATFQSTVNTGELSNLIPYLMGERNHWCL